MQNTLVQIIIGNHDQNSAQLPLHSLLWHCHSTSKTGTIQLPKHLHSFLELQTTNCTKSLLSSVDAPFIVWNWNRKKYTFGTAHLRLEIIYLIGRLWLQVDLIQTGIENAPLALFWADHEKMTFKSLDIMKLYQTISYI